MVPGLSASSSGKYLRNRRPSGSRVSRSDFRQVLSEQLASTYDISGSSLRAHFPLREFYCPPLAEITGRSVVECAAELTGVYRQSTYWMFSRMFRVDKYVGDSIDSPLRLTNEWHVNHRIDLSGTQGKGQNSQKGAPPNSSTKAWCSGEY